MKCFGVFIVAATIACSGCISYVHPDRGDVTLDASPNPPVAPAPVGYLAITAGFDLQSFFGYPSIAFDLKNLDSGDTTHLIVTTEEMEAFGKDLALVPLIYRLAPGRYEMTKSQMQVPAGSRGRWQYSSVDQPLGLEKHIKPFVIEDGKVAHLVVAKFTLKESMAGREKFLQTTTTWEFRRPDGYAWKPYQGLLARSQATFQQKNAGGVSEWRPLQFVAADYDPANSLEGQKKARHAVIETRHADIKACNAQHPGAHGDVVIRYVIAPDGRVDEVKIKSSKLKQSSTEKCVVEIFRTFKFAKTPSGAYDAWLSTWNF